MPAVSRPYFAIVRPLVGLMIFLVVLEASLRQGAVKRILPLPSPYYNEEVMLRTKLLMEFGDPDVVFVGSSIARSNLDIQVVSSVLKKRCFGLGLSALAPGQSLEFWKNHWSRRLPEDVSVVYLLRPVDLSDGFDSAHIGNLDKGRIERGWVDPSQRSILDQSWFPHTQLSDYYGALSKAVTSRRRPILGTPFLTDRLGSAPYSGELNETKAKEISATQKSLPAVTSLIKRGSFQTVIAEFKSLLGNRLIVAPCPWYSGSESQTAEYERFCTELEEYGRLLGIRVVAPDSGGLQRDRRNYSDSQHFNKVGAQKFSRILAKALVAEFSKFK